MTLRTIFGILLCAALLAGCGTTNIFKDDDRSGYTAEQYYEEAKALLEDEKYTKAVELYQELEGNYPFGSYTEQAQLEVIYAYYKNDEPEAALSAAERFIRLHPTHPNVDYAYYLKGLVNYTAENTLVDKWAKGESSPDRDPQSTLEAYNAFQDLVNRFPESRYAADSLQRMGFLQNSLAMHEVHVADYYMRRGAHVAVVNRAKFILNEHPRTAAVEHALGLMMLSYERMGLDDLASDSRRVLTLNYPDSAYLSGRRPAIKREFTLIPASFEDLNPFD